MPKPEPQASNLIESVVSLIVRECFPEELDVLPTIWMRWSQISVNTDSIDAVWVAGIPMLGSDQNEFFTPFVIMTIAAVMDSLPHRSNLPELSNVRAAVFEAAKSFGLSGKRLDTLVEAVAPRLYEAFNRLCGAETETATISSNTDHSSEQSLVWIEWWLDGKLINPQVVEYETLISDDRTSQVVLTVDETKGTLTGPAKKRSFDVFSQRGLRGVWLALDKTGGYFSYEDIKKRRRDPKWSIEERALQKYANEARRILETIVGSPIVPRPRRKRYYIPADLWSWCWIREVQDRDQSMLLR